jgi:hypothetical protein
MLATEASAATLKEVAGIAAGVADQMTSLSKTLIAEALPKWLGKVEEDKKSAQGSIDQAKESLRWAIRAVWASVVATGLFAGLQMWQSHAYKLESDAGQADSDKRVQAQLDEARRTNTLLEAQLAELKTAPAAKLVVPPKLASDSQATVQTPRPKGSHRVHKG